MNAYAQGMYLVRTGSTRTCAGGQPQSGATVAHGADARRRVAPALGAVGAQVAPGGPKSAFVIAGIAPKSRSAEGPASTSEWGHLGPPPNIMSVFLGQDVLPTCRRRSQSLSPAELGRGVSPSHRRERHTMMTKGMLQLLRILAAHDARLWEIIHPHVWENATHVAMQDATPPKDLAAQELQFAVQDTVRAVAEATIAAFSMGQAEQAQGMLDDVDGDWCGMRWPHWWPKPGPRAEQYMQEDRSAQALGAGSGRHHLRLLRREHRGREAVSGVRQGRRQSRRGRAEDVAGRRQQLGRSSAGRRRGR